MAQTLNGKLLKLLAIIGSIISFGFMFIYITGIRNTGVETMGRPIWWNHLRPVHSFFFASFAIMAFIGNKNAHIPLALDVIVGFSSFVAKYFIF